VYLLGLDYDVSMLSFSLSAASSVSLLPTTIMSAFTPRKLDMNMLKDLFFVFLER
jgi:hypothetical protein